MADIKQQQAQIIVEGCLSWVFRFCSKLLYSILPMWQTPDSRLCELPSF